MAYYDPTVHAANLVTGAIGAGTGYLYGKIVSRPRVGMKSGSAKTATTDVFDKKGGQAAGNILIFFHTSIWIYLDVRLFNF